MPGKKPPSEETLTKANNKNEQGASGKPVAPIAAGGSGQSATILSEPANGSEKGSAKEKIRFHEEEIKELEILSRNYAESLESVASTIARKRGKVLQCTVEDLKAADRQIRAGLARRNTSKKICGKILSGLSLIVFGYLISTFDPELSEKCAITYPNNMLLLVASIVLFIFGSYLESLD